MTELSRATASDLIARGRVLINGRSCKAASRPVAGARIDVEPPAAELSTALAEQIDVAVVYEDETIVVVDKPAGMVVHPAPGNMSGTLVNALLGRYASLPGDPQRPGIVHRLDKDTSGLIVVARTPAAVAALSRAFKNREVYKEYSAVVMGALVPPSGTIRADIGRDPRHRQRMAVVGAAGERHRRHTGRSKRSPTIHWCGCGWTRVARTKSAYISVHSDTRWLVTLSTDVRPGEVHRLGSSCTPRCCGLSTLLQASQWSSPRSCPRISARSWIDCAAGLLGRV